MKRIPKQLKMRLNHVYHTSDNNEFITQLPDDCIDLIYLDPPFFTGRDWSNREGKQFTDKWKSRGVYVDFIASRLIGLKRVLKNTGSIYLHCDAACSHYIKIAMDDVFGDKNFRNEIIWKRASNKNSANDKFGRVTDRIFFYGRLLNPKDVMIPVAQEHIDKEYRNIDERGRYSSMPTIGEGITKSGQSSKPWRGYDPAKVGKGYHWAVPKDGDYAKFIDQHIPGYCKEPDLIKRLELLDKHGFIHWTSNDTPRMKRYLVEDQLQILNDVWDDIPVVKGKEAWNYPTQKPLKLLSRIIKASSNEGDIVFDPFCGSGTTLVAAKKLRRKFIGCDNNEDAVKLTKQRIRKVFGLFAFELTNEELK